MNIVSIEPTPSPNAMKLNMDETLPKGKSMTYTATADHSGAPEYIQRLLKIAGVKSVFQVADFISLERKGGDWQQILAQARSVFGGSADDGGNVAHGDGAEADKLEEAAAADHYGEALVRVQMFRDIPMQVRVITDTEEARLVLPERFSKAVMEVQAQTHANFIMERKLVDQGTRYGELQEIAEQIAKELDAAYDQERLNQLVDRACALGGGGNGGGNDSSQGAEPAVAAAGNSMIGGAGVIRRNIAPTTVSARLASAEIAEHMRHPDWRKRYAAFVQLQPTERDIPLLELALKDANTSIRRLATVYLGDIKTPQALELLFIALKDEAVPVRRTAGDCLSDIGDPAAIAPMSDSLSDPSKIVRWRAARFLYEAGDDSALEALRNAHDDPEFEVRMQIQLAIARIEGGEAAEGSVWQQMTRSRREQSE